MLVEHPSMDIGQRTSAEVDEIKLVVFERIFKKIFSLSVKINEEGAYE